MHDGVFSRLEVFRKHSEHVRDNETREPAEPSLEANAPLHAGGNQGRVGVQGNRRPAVDNNLEEYGTCESANRAVNFDVPRIVGIVPAEQEIPWIEFCDRRHDEFGFD